MPQTHLLYPSFIYSTDSNEKGCWDIRSKNSKKEDKEKALSSGCVGFISKPIKKNILKDEVTTWFEKNKSLYTTI